MNIVHITSAFRPYAVGGAEVVVTNLAQRQAQDGHSVSILHLSPDERQPYAEGSVAIYPIRPPYLVGIGDHAASPALVRKLNKIQIPINGLAVQKISSIINSIEPDIVHTHSLPDISTFIWPAAKSAGARVVHTLHDYDLVCGRATLFKGGNCERIHSDCKVHGFLKRLPLNAVDRFVSISQKVIDKHLEHRALGERELSRTSVIWNGSPEHDGSGGLREPRAGRPLTFGFIGRLVPEKGVGFLIEACRALPTSGWSLKIAGKAPVSDRDFREAAQGLPIEFVGWRDSQHFLEEVDVLIVPSLWDEPFGLTVIEGVRAGIPVIGSNRGAIPEILSDIYPDLVFDAEAPETLTNLLLDFIRGRSCELGDALVLSFSKKVSIERMASSYYEVYNSAILSNSPGV